MSCLTYTTDVQVDPLHRKYKMVINTIEDGRHTCCFSANSENARKCVDEIHKQISSYYPTNIADELCIALAMKYRQYDDIILEQCNRYGEPHRPYAVPDNHSRFLLSLNNLIVPTNNDGGYMLS